MEQNDLTPATQVKQIVELHLQGLSKVNIAKVTRIGRSEVTCILKYLVPQAYLDENFSALLGIEQLKLELDTEKKELTKINSFAKKCKESNTILTTECKTVNNRLKDEIKELKAELEDYQSSKMIFLGKKFSWI